MKTIDDFRGNILAGINQGLIESVTAHWEDYSMRAYEINNHPEKLEAEGVSEDILDEYYTRTNTGIVLITHPEMKKVWSRVNPIIYKEPDDYYGFFFKFTGYVSSIHAALAGGSYWQKLPPTKRKIEYEELVLSLKKVAHTLSKVAKPIRRFTSQRTAPQ